MSCSQNGWTGPIYPNSSDTNAVLNGVENCGDLGCLFNIRDDPTEHINLAEKMPSVLEDMRKKLTGYQESQFKPDTGEFVMQMACDTAMNKYGGFWGPFLQ